MFTQSVWRFCISEVLQSFSHQIFQGPPGWRFTCFKSSLDPEISHLVGEIPKYHPKQTSKKNVTKWSLFIGGTFRIFHFQTLSGKLWCLNWQKIGATVWKIMEASLLDYIQYSCDETTGACTTILKCTNYIIMPLTLRLMVSIKLYNYMRIVLFDEWLASTSI